VNAWSFRMRALKRKKAVYEPFYEKIFIINCFFFWFKSGYNGFLDFFSLKFILNIKLSWLLT